MLYICCVSSPTRFEGAGIGTRLPHIMKRVIGFDSWTGGAPFYQRLLPALAKRSMEMRLVHIGSWGNEPDCPKVTEIDGLSVRDLSYYPGGAVQTMLDVEKPEAVILLSTDTFAHRAVIRYCNQRSIPTLNLYHGLVNVQSTQGDVHEVQVSRLAYARYVAVRIGKLIRHTFPCYIRSLLETRATVRDWRRFSSDVCRLAVGRFPVKAAADAKTDKCAVYTPADVEHAMRVYGFDRDDVVVVGNPDLMQFGMRPDMLASWDAGEASAPKTIMYIETGLASVGLYYAGADDFADHLISSAQALSEQGYTMLVKLKPRQTYDAVVSRRLEAVGIRMVTNSEFLPTLMKCSACISETTTLAMIPALLGMPLLLAGYGRLSPLPFGSVLTTYPRAHRLRDPREVSALLEQIRRSADKRALDDWIEQNAGPLPATLMPDRVGEIVEGLIAERRAS